MIHEIGKSLGVPVSRFSKASRGMMRVAERLHILPVDVCIDFIATKEGRHLIERMVRLPPRVRARVSARIAAIGEELSAPNGDEEQ
ncbi:MAG: hypothetical protein EKK31_04170 [Hyphomicrobiales bacterium]|nr:MAG: hypothetical protein EKK31_04170 [Hyphomicrobiales bacterium]